MMSVYHDILTQGQELFIITRQNYMRRANLSLGSLQVRGNRSHILGFLVRLNHGT